MSRPDQSGGDDLSRPVSAARDIGLGALIGVVGWLALNLPFAGATVASDPDPGQLLWPLLWGLWAGFAGGVAAHLTRLLEARITVRGWVIVLCAGVMGALLGGGAALLVVKAMAIPDGFQDDMGMRWFVTIVGGTQSALVAAVAAMLTLRWRMLMDAVRDKPVRR